MKERLISANKLRENVLDLPNCYNGFSDAYDKAMIIDLVDEQPTVDAEPVRHGHWEYVGGNLYRCSVCHKGLADDDNILTGQENYCGVCGAKMDEVEDE